MSVCPTPWKEGMTKREAKRAIRDMRTRYRTSKRSAPAVSPYECPCGQVHLSGNSRARRKMV